LCEDIWWESTSVLRLRVFRHLWSRSDAPCSSILHGYSHLPQAKIWASLGVPSFPIRSRRKTSRPEGTPLDLRLPHGKIVIILRCNPGLQAGHRKVCFRGFVWKNRPKSENWATLTLRSSATVRHTEKLIELINSLALGLYNAE